MPLTPCKARTQKTFFQTKKFYLARLASKFGKSNMTLKKGFSFSLVVLLFKTTKKWKKIVQIIKKCKGLKPFQFFPQI
jgi:hypothetical protein